MGATQLPINNMDKHKISVQNTFDRAASEYGEKGCSFFNYFGERLVEIANPLPGDHILDVATGKGAVLFPAARKVGPKGKAVGIDLSQKMMEEALKKIDLPWVEWKQMDAENLSFPEETFDLLFCAFGLFFFPHLQQALKGFKRVLKPEGKLAVTTFGKKGEHDLWITEKLKEMGVKTKLTAVSLDQESILKNELEQAGFNQIKFYTESKLFWHANAEEWWNSLWTHGIRYRLEQLSSTDLEALKKEALEYAGRGEVSEERNVIYAISKVQ